MPQRSRSRGCNRRRSRRTRRHQRGGVGTVRVAWGGTIEASPTFPEAPKAAVQSEPRVSWRNGGGLTTFLCWDPDAPAASWLHWLVINCSGDSLASGTTIVPWAPPSPPPGTGTHRYEFAVLQQPGPLSIEPPKERGHFSPDAFFKEHGLQRMTQQPIGIRVAAASAAPSA
jgi:phosphatidylethanolamine-binding protein (PEBP) family uncharacterized protein